MREKVFFITFHYGVIGRQIPASAGKLLKQHTDGALDDIDEYDDEREEDKDEEDDAADPMHRNNPVGESEHVSPAVAHVTSACVCDTVSLNEKQQGLSPVVNSQTFPLRIGWPVHVPPGCPPLLVIIHVGSELQAAVARDWQRFGPPSMLARHS